MKRSIKYSMIAMLLLSSMFICASFPTSIVIQKGSGLDNVNSFSVIWLGPKGAFNWYNPTEAQFDQSIAVPSGANTVNIVIGKMSYSHLLESGVTKYTLVMKSSPVGLGKKKSKVEQLQAQIQQLQVQLNQAQAEKVRQQFDLLPVK